MASLWRKPHSGVWCITYREDGKQRVRSLRMSCPLSSRALLAGRC
jgi:hypothetical protein